MKNHGQGAAAKAAPADHEWIRDLIAMAVHDLREPLRAVRLGTQLVNSRLEGGEEEDAVRGRRYVEDGLDRVESLIQDISEFCNAQFEDSDFQETDLESVLVEVQKELHHDLKCSGAVVTYDPLPTVPGDEASLACVFRALLSNACRFRGEAAPRVHVSAMREGSEWLFTVSDNGAGFGPAYSERIFRPFERLNGRQYPGSGLGLSTARTIIQRHGGKIWAESQPGNGATFRFTLPG